MIVSHGYHKFSLALPHFSIHSARKRKNIRDTHGEKSHRTRRERIIKTLCIYWLSYNIDKRKSSWVLTGERASSAWRRTRKSFIELIENNSIFIRKRTFLALRYRAAVSQGLIKWILYRLRVLDRSIVVWLDLASRASNWDWFKLFYDVGKLSCARDKTNFNWPQLVLHRAALFDYCPRPGIFEWIFIITALRNGKFTRN